MDLQKMWTEVSPAPLFSFGEQPVHWPLENKGFWKDKKPSQIC